MINDAAALLRSRPNLEKTLYLASSDEKVIAEATQKLAQIFGKNAGRNVRWHYEKMPQEKHSTIYHPAALKAFRSVFKIAPAK